MAAFLQLAALPHPPLPRADRVDGSARAWRPGRRGSLGRRTRSLRSDRPVAHLLVSEPGSVPPSARPSAARPVAPAASDAPGERRVLRNAVAGPADQAAGPSDAVLVSRVAAGDAEALGALYDRHGATTYALARAIVGEASDADDVVAGAFEQLWRSAPSFDATRGSVAAWLTMITRSRALDHLRAQRRRARLVERAAADDSTVGAAVPLGGSADAPDAAVEHDEMARAVRASLAALPDAQRQAIELAFFGGLTHTDVAATLGQPLGTVKTRIRTGLLRLREALRPWASGGGA